MSKYEFSSSSNWRKTPMANYMKLSKRKDERRNFKEGVLGGDSLREKKAAIIDT